jgi:hypothetical protein
MSTTTNFQSALSEDHHRPALRRALSKYPTSDSHELALQLIKLLADGGKRLASIRRGRQAQTAENSTQLGTLDHDSCRSGPRRGLQLADAKRIFGRLQ